MLLPAELGPRLQPCRNLQAAYLGVDRKVVFQRLSRQLSRSSSCELASLSTFMAFCAHAAAYNIITIHQQQCVIVVSFMRRPVI